jgi:hypothetical protein
MIAFDRRDGKVNMGKHIVKRREREGREGETGEGKLSILQKKEGREGRMEGQCVREGG